MSESADEFFAALDTTYAEIVAYSDSVLERIGEDAKASDAVRYIMSDTAISANFRGAALVLIGYVWGHPNE